MKKYGKADFCEEIGKKISTPLKNLCPKSWQDIAQSIKLWNYLPSGTIQTCTELEITFLEIFFYQISVCGKKSWNLKI